MEDVRTLHCATSFLPLRMTLQGQLCFIKCFRKGSKVGSGAVSHYYFLQAAATSCSPSLLFMWRKLGSRRWSVLPSVQNYYSSFYFHSAAVQKKFSSRWWK